MPRLEKTASAVIAALVVAVAATVTSLASPPAPDGDPAASSAPSTAGEPRTSPAASAGSASPARGTDGGGRRPSGAVPESVTVLFVGRSPELNPRGGVSRSFMCRAAARLRWTCLVREGPAPVVPATAAADAVVVALAVEDDAARVTRLLDRLPAGLDRARLILLGPTTAPAARRSIELRQVAARRGAVFVDPAAAGWFSGPAGAGAFVRGGKQLSAAGQARCAERLADVLDTLVRA